jgi:SHS2 domain-containing protein
MPFEELSHTADWCLRVWAGDLVQLFVDAARGMNTLAGIRLAEMPRVQRIFSTSADDAESMLVSFLTELVYFAEQDHLAFDNYELSIDPGAGQSMHLSALLQGAPIFSVDKAIKAVTYHNLQIRQTKKGLEVEIVLDV